jgi:hypothetical protein
MILALRTPRPFGVPIGKSRGLVACGSSASPIPYTKLKKPASRAGFLYLAGQSGANQSPIKFPVIKGKYREYFQAST